MRLKLITSIMKSLTKEKIKTVPTQKDIEEVNVYIWTTQGMEKIYQDEEKFGYVKYSDYLKALNSK